MPSNVDRYWNQYIESLPVDADRPSAYVDSYYFGINPDRPVDVGSAKCVKFANPNEDTARAALEDLRQRYVTGRSLAFSDRAGKVSVQIFALGDD